MANRNDPNGFEAVRHKNAGSMITSNVYTIADTYATKIHNGDAVRLLAAGVIERAPAGGDILGIFTGCAYTLPSGKREFNSMFPGVAGYDDVEMFVIDDPDVIFKVQANTALTQAAIGDQADLVATVGNDATGRSKETLGALVGAGNSAQFTVLALVDNFGNEFGANQDLLVEINEHQRKASVNAV